MKSAIERVIVVGAGAMGATYAALFHALNPYGVAFIADGERVERVKKFFDRRGSEQLARCPLRP